MQITILTTGTRGDLQPYIALARELKRAGHHVRIAAFENYQSFVQKFGLDFYPIRGDVAKIASSDLVCQAMQADNPIKVLLSFNKLKSLVFGVQKDYFNACTGSDVIVYHPGAAIGYYIGQHMHIPSVLATPFPMTLTREYPSLIFYDKIRMGGEFNLLTHKIFEQIMWSASSSAVKQFWKQEFGSTPRPFFSPFSKQNTPKLPTLISCSDFVFPKPADYPAHVYQFGYWFLDEEPDWRPPEDLLDFLQQGSPPVYVGFGSMGNPSLAQKTTELVIGALEISGQRGVLATGWNGMSDKDVTSEDIFILNSAPHSWLFPRMAAVVHHGGAGTTAAGLRAGVPNIVIPHSNDQFAWGRRVFELGAGSKPAPRKKLTAKKLAQAISSGLAEEIRVAAEELGKQIQSENGAIHAAEIVLQCSNKGGR